MSEQTEQASGPGRQRKQAAQTESQAERKARLMAAAEAAIDELLQWEEQSVKPNLAAIEEQVLAVRQRLGVVLGETLLEKQAAQSAAEMAVQTPRCPTCGSALVNKGKRKKVVTSRLGELESKRPYAWCPVCNHGVFPPGRPT
jgi:DNA-directed RNA polymerase subunit RPC12/RpoP